MAGSDRRFVTLIVIVLLIGAAALGYVVSRRSQAVVTTIDPNAELPAPQGQLAGLATAPVEIIEFADFECPGCMQWATMIEPDVRRLLVNTGVARFRFVDHPIPSIHPSTLTAHNAAACAASQNKFWEMHDRIYFGQYEWSHAANGRDMNAPKIMKRYAKELGLDAKLFETCLDARQHELQIRANYNEGARLGVRSTPTFLIGDRMITQGATYDVIKAIVDSVTAERAKKK